MPRIIEGTFDGKGKKIAIVNSRWNSFITERLLEGALDALKRHGVDTDADVDVAYCPGSFEIPLVVQKLAASGSYDSVIALGAVIRGSTPHFDYVAAEVTKGVASVMLSTGVPCLFGVLTTDTIEQAIERAGTKAGNKGFEVATAALEMMNLIGNLR